MAETGMATHMQVRVHDLQVAARIGAYPHEEGRHQKLRIAVRLDIVPAAIDQLGATVDYCAVVAHAEALAGEHIALIETFASRLAASCLAERGVLRAEVEVEKPGALANGVASVSVRMER